MLKVTFSLLSILLSSSSFADSAFSIDGLCDLYLETKDKAYDLIEFGGERKQDLSPDFLIESFRNLKSNRVSSFLHSYDEYIKKGFMALI